MKILKVMSLYLLLFSEVAFSFFDIDFEEVVQSGTDHELLTPEQKKAIDAFIEIEASEGSEQDMIYG